MKLRNKKTGEIGCLECSFGKTPEKITVIEFVDGYRGSKAWYYNSLAELNAEWEDYEEPKEYWFINSDGVICAAKRGKYPDSDFLREVIGNRFETEEEAERAEKKLEAWTRLINKGFRFTGWEDLQAEMGIDDLMLFNRDVIDADNVIGFKMDDYGGCVKDLDICFGGEE